MPALNNHNTAVDILLVTATAQSRHLSRLSDRLKPTGEYPIAHAGHDILNTISRRDVAEKSLWSNMSNLLFMILLSSQLVV